MSLLEVMVKGLQVQQCAVLCCQEYLIQLCYLPPHRVPRPHRSQYLLVRTDRYYLCWSLQGYLDSWRKRLNKPRECNVLWTEVAMSLQQSCVTFMCTKHVQSVPPALSVSGPVVTNCSRFQHQKGGNPKAHPGLGQSRQWHWEALSPVLPL